MWGLTEIIASTLWYYFLSLIFIVTSQYQKEPFLLSQNSVCFIMQTYSAHALCDINAIASQKPWSLWFQYKKAIVNTCFFPPAQILAVFCPCLAKSIGSNFQFNKLNTKCHILFTYAQAKTPLILIIILLNPLCKFLFMINLTELHLCKISIHIIPLIPMRTLYTHKADVSSVLFRFEIYILKPYKL